MPYTQGPYTSTSLPAIVPGTAVAITIDRAAQWVQVHNDSPYRLYFQLDGSKPTAVDSLNGQYLAMAAPGGHPVIPIQRPAASRSERMLNAIRDFQGVLWVMPIDPRPAAALTGTVSGQVDVHVDVYLPGERVPDPWAIPRQFDISSQPRVISIPPPGGQLWNGTWFTTTFPTFPIGVVALSTAIAAAHQGYLYLYHLAMFPAGPIGTTILATGFSLQLIPQNSGGVDLDVSTTIYTGLVMWIRDNTNHNALATPVIVQPHFPLATPISFPAGSTQLKIQLLTTSGSPSDCLYDVAVGVDNNNLVSPPGVGGAATGYANWVGSYTPTAGLW